MRRSEKILLAILLLGVLAWQGARTADRFLFDPIRRSRAEMDRLDERVAEQKIRTAELASAEKRLQRWRQQSLPPDPLTAQRLYQQWLTDLAQDCGFAALKVYPDRVIRKSDACAGVLVSINAETTLNQLCSFLSRFYRTDLAQQIVLLSMDSTQDRGDPILRVAIIAEGLSLRDASPRQQLFPDGTPASDSLTNEAADYANLVASNPFAKPALKIVQRPQPPQDETPELDPAEFTFLIAAFAQDDERQAWLYDRLNDEKFVINSGKPFSVAGVEGVVREIGNDFVLLDCGRSRWRLRLGKNLRSMEPVSATEGTASPPAGQQ